MTQAKNELGALIAEVIAWQKRHNITSITITVLAGGSAGYAYGWTDSERIEAHVGCEPYKAETPADGAARESD